MRKLFFDNVFGDELVISGDDHKHVAFSLRARRGDEIVICANGIDYTAKITEITKTQTTVKIVDKARNSSEPETEITLFFGALKGDKNDYVVQKCTELGVKKFVPFVSEFSSVKSENIKTERLNRIALEAAKQSGRGCVPTVSDVIKIDDLYDFLNSYELVLFPYEHEKQLQIKDFLAKSNRGKTAIVIGSEGGFSQYEASRIHEIAKGSVTLGERILRADTACVAVTSVLMYELGEWSRRV